MSGLKFNCVLMVDNDGISNFTNHRLIKKMNITTSIQSAINGNEAIHFLKQFCIKNADNGPELLLLDIDMSVLNVSEFLSHFKKMNFKNKENIKIIILTPSPHQNDLPNNPNPQISYINKPLTQEKLLEKLKNIGTTGQAGAV